MAGGWSRTGRLLRIGTASGLTLARNGLIAWRQFRQEFRQGCGIARPQARTRTREDHASEQRPQRGTAIHLTH
jgi:hypothetical protein